MDKQAGSRTQRKRRPSVVVESDEDLAPQWAREGQTTAREERERNHVHLANGYGHAGTTARARRGSSRERKNAVTSMLPALDLSNLPTGLWSNERGGYFSSWLRPKRRSSNINGISPASASMPKLPLFGGGKTTKSPKLRTRSRAWTTRQKVLACLGLLFFLLIVRPRVASVGRILTLMRFRDPIISLELSPAMVRRIWAWEVAAGHFPSHRMPLEIGLSNNDLGGLGNPGLPPAEAALHSVYLIPRTGAKRQYLEVPATYGPILVHPPRPAPRTIVDLDVIMGFCEFSANRYVRDCLEIMNAASALDRKQTHRRSRPATWRHLFFEEESWPGRIEAPEPREDGEDVLRKLGYVAPKQENILGPIENPPRHRSLHLTADPACDPERPRIFHILWAGPFTDKPYAAAMSFLYTQNLGLHLPLAHQPDVGGKRAEFLRHHCRPQMWIHINPGAAASVQTQAMRERMMDDLHSNPWSAPLLDERFSEVISFHFYNISDHLDAIPELRNEWRHLPLFKSGQVTFNQKPYDDPKQQVMLHNEVKLAQARLEEEREAKQQAIEGDQPAVTPGSGQRRRVKGEDETYVDGEAPAGAVDNALVTEDERLEGETDGRPPRDPVDLDQRRPPTPATARAKSETSMFDRVGSTSYAEYDRLTTTLSDMARFVLCHRYGGVYIDADTLLLRDWEELWNWRGAFAYRWSRLPEYNTAILRMHRGSALGSFIFKIALANGLDFHPMSIWQYLSRAKLHGLLLRLPDALFDPAWLNTEYYQRDRPPFPYFASFSDFFQPSNETAAAPNIVGVEHFFRGSFAYHWHNQWWTPFDPTRDYPELGPRFHGTEAIARARFNARLAASNATIPPETSVPDGDLSWATVLKRTYEAYVRGERPNLYGEMITFETSSDDER